MVRIWTTTAISGVSGVSGTASKSPPTHVDQSGQPDGHARQSGRHPITVPPRHAGLRTSAFRQAVQRQGFGRPVAQHGAGGAVPGGGAEPAAHVIKEFARLALPGEPLISRKFTAVFQRHDIVVGADVGAAVPATAAPPARAATLPDGPRTVRRAGRRFAQHPDMLEKLRLARDGRNRVRFADYRRAAGSDDDAQFRCRLFAVADAADVDALPPGTVPARAANAAGP
jgi:hypothetical protein